MAKTEKSDYIGLWKWCLFAYIVNTYGTSFMQTYPSIRRDIAGFATNIVRQLSKVFDKSALFYAKQSQFPKSPNERKLLFAKGL